MQRIVAIVIVGVIAGLIARKVGMPGGAVVGSMIGSGLTAVVLPGSFALPWQVGTAIQIMLGISLGLTFDRSFLGIGAKIWPIAIVSTVLLLGVAVMMALAAQRLGLVDFPTALFGFSPGGMSGMSLLAQAEGYRTAVVAFFHVVRIFTLFLLVPVLGRLLRAAVRGP